MVVKENWKDVMTNKAGKKTKPSRTSRVLRGTVDSGWAWVIMLALAFWNILIAGSLKSFGVIYLEYLDLYQRGPVATAWMGFSFSIVITVLAPVSGYLGDHVSLSIQRVMVMCLGVVMATAIAATGWMPNLGSAIATYGMAGFAASLVDTPILSLLGKYFKDRRFLASGIVFAGSSLGTLVLPPMFTILVDTYAIRGAMVVFGGVWLNVIVVGAVIRPVRQPDTTTTTTRATTEEFETPTPLDLQKLKSREKSADILHEINVAEKCLRDFNNDVYREITQSSLSLGLQPFGLDTFIGGSRRSVNRLVSDYKRGHRHPQSESVPCLPMAVTLDSQTLSVCDVRTANNNEDTPSDRTQSDIRNAHHHEGITDASHDDTYLCDDCKPEALSFGKKLCDIVRSYWLFLKTPGLPLLIITFCTASFAYFNQFFIFPPLAREYGMTKMQGAMLVSVSNITELMSRLVVGLLVDKGKVGKPCLIKVSFVLSAMLAMTASFFSNHVVVFVYSGVFGLLGGIFIPLAIPLMVELVPSSQISSAAGIYVLVTGVGISLGPPVLGAVKSLTGTFADSLRLCSVFYLLALGFYVVNQGNFANCARKRKQAKDSGDIVLTVDVP